MIRALVLVLALATLARADCDPAVTAGATDTRTGTTKGAYQLCHWETIWNTVVQKLWDNLNVGVISATIPGPTATDDHVPLPWIARVDTTLTQVACRTEGTCTTPPTYSVESDTGSAMTLGATLTCTTGSTAATWVAITGGGAVAKGHTVRFNTTNTPSGDCTFAIVSITGAETLP